MRSSFIHLADIHLGYEQYGVRERFNDFTHAFWRILKDAEDRNVDFVAIAGDLFNKRAIDAMTLAHALDGLKRLKAAGIPVLAVEGNHDRSYYRDGFSWMQFLSYEGYLTLLSPEMRDGVPVIAPWSQETMQGAYVDLMDGRLRVYGLPWQGSATIKSMEGMAQAMREVRADEDARGVEYRLLMMHTGLDEMSARIQGLPSMAHFQPLQECVDYLALGHVHKPYALSGWMYNPGSTETCSAEEAQWQDRGYFYVQVDTDEPERIGIRPDMRERVHRAEQIVGERRPFIRHNLRVDGLDEPHALHARLEDYCRQEGDPHPEAGKEPVVQISLFGTLSFDAGALDISHMEEIVREAFHPLYVRVENNTNDQDYIPDDDALDGRDRTTWHELERHILEELVARDNRYLPAKEQWGAVLADLKRMSLDDDDPVHIADYLRERRETLLER
jgi:DNA repair exonuclease SbcCD nuclease subunit